MESAVTAPDRIALPRETIRFIIFHYFDRAHTYFQQEPETKKITKNAYIQNICCVSQSFYQQVNQKEIINKLIKFIPSKCDFPSQTDMWGIILCRKKSTELRDFVDKITEHSFQRKTEPSEQMVFTIKKAIEKRIDEGADIDGRLFPFQKKESCSPYPNETCLYLAVQRDCSEYTKILLDLGANPDFTKSEYTPLQKAVHNKNIPMMQLLFDFGACNRCLVEAVKIKYVPAIELIISKEDISETELYQALATASQASDNMPIIALLKTVKRKENPKTFIRRNGRIFSSSDSL